MVTEQCDTTFSIAASQLGVGSYSSYFSVYNGSGGVDTSRVSFLIPERKNLGDEFIARVQNKSSKNTLLLSVTMLRVQRKKMIIHSYGNLCGLAITVIK